MSTNIFPLRLLLVTIILVTAAFASSQAAFCTYSRRRNSVSCGSVTCNTAEAGSSELPAGYYYIGNHYLHGTAGTPWFNLYRQRSSGGGFWDYYTRVPELGCRGGFGLHSGDNSAGCITVTNSNCFTQLKNEIINNFPVIYFNVYECRNCHQGWWSSGYRCSWTQTVSRPCTADLQSNNY